jgi:hypothetical protein
LFYTGFLILTSYLIPSSIRIVLYWFPNINIGGRNRSTWRKPQTCRKSLTNVIIYFIEL